MLERAQNMRLITIQCVLSGIFDVIERSVGEKNEIYSG